MSLIFFDGFDGYDAAADLTAFGGWAAVTAAPSSTVRLGAGKSIVTVFTSSYANKLLADQAGNTLFAGFAFARNEVGNGASMLHFDNTSALNSSQCTLSLNSANKLELHLGTHAGPLLATGSATLADGVFYYLEVKALIANTSGVFEVRIDGVVDATYTGDTQNAANNSVLAVTLGGYAANNSGVAGYYDDFYVLNSVGSANNSYLGEQRCEIMTPTADSAVAWTRNTGASNFSAVDDAIGAPDDDVTYVSSLTSLQKDEYGLSDLTGVNTVAGVKLVTRAEKDDANPLSLKTGIKSGATDQQVVHALGVGYANFIDLFETSDGASTAFTPTTVNSLLSTLEIP